jgi:agmatine deiminase
MSAGASSQAAGSHGGAPTSEESAAPAQPLLMPAEWELHERTIMGWPCRAELWGETVERAKADYAEVANAIAAFEPVTMITNPGADAAAARAACGAGVEIVELPLDDSWLRDCGPIYARRPDGRRCAVHFRFNSWGERFAPWDKDAAVGALVAKRLGDPVISAPLVLEGGSICVDGAGTLLTTEQCLLNPNRNPELSREQIEGALGTYLGADRIVWLGKGLIEDRDTDGHVDMIAAFTDIDGVLLQTVDEQNPNFDNCEENRSRLESEGIDVTPLPFLPYTTVAGERVAVGYMNFYLINRAVIVPTIGAETDERALAMIADAYPGREVVPVRGDVLSYGGGGPHCITQQVPTKFEESADDDGV